MQVRSCVSIKVNAYMFHPGIAAIRAIGMNELHKN
jgi:hypothetical protein